MGLLAGLFEGKAKRKTFVAREDLIDRLSKVAKERGYSLYALVNEVFGLALKAEEMDLDLGRVIEERGVLETARKAGFILGLESLWYDMADFAYEKAKSRILKSWFEAGVWFAKRYATSGTADPLGAFKRDLKAFMWNAPEFNVEEAENKLSIRVISPRFSEAYTFLLASFFEGALEAFNYNITEREVFRGNIRLEAIRKDSNG
ncbi:MAG: hypothetical protein QXJ63_00980 [Candidatus Bathyarchaeia archaeon]